MNILDWFRGRRRQRRFVDGAGAAHEDRPANVIGAGAQLRGTLTGSGNYIVSGHFEGDGEIEGNLVLMAGAWWKGNITARNVIIAGKLHGNVMAQDRLELSASARIHGDLTAPTIAIAEGAAYQGQVRTTKRGHIKRFKERRDAERTPYLLKPVASMQTDGEDG